MTGNRDHGKKATNAEIEQRISEVYQLVVNGARRAKILRHATDSGWDINERQIDRYIARATDMMREAAIVDREKELGRAIARLHDLYERAHADGNHATSLAILREMTQLTGVAAAAKLEISGPDGGPVQTSTVDISKLSRKELEQIHSIMSRAIGPGDASTT